MIELMTEPTSQLDNRMHAGHVLVIYDGQCGLCSRTVRWLLRRDRHARLRFIAAESPRAAGLIARSGIASSPGTRPSSILAVHDAETPQERIDSRSEAIRTVLRELPQPWPFAAAALGLVPRSLRDLAYQLIARLRHRLGPRSCPAFTPAERQRFLA
jgi:predicted DCC family thiol-disulfide oxidoreductase YuxK